MRNLRLRCAIEDLYLLRGIETQGLPRGFRPGEANDATARDRSNGIIRFAVSPEEHEAYKKYVRENFDGVFYNRILNVPLVVEADPEHPTFTKEKL